MRCLEPDAAARAKRVPFDNITHGWKRLSLANPDEAFGADETDFPRAEALRGDGLLVFQTIPIVEDRGLERRRQQTKQESIALRIGIPEDQIHVVHARRRPEHRAKS